MFSHKFDKDFVCLLGRGDSGKTTILDAISLVLSPNWNTPVCIDGSKLAVLIKEVKIAEQKPDLPPKSRAVLIPTEPPSLTKEEKNIKYMPPAVRAALEDEKKTFSDVNPVCPHCGKSMVLRIAHRGPTPGAKFWGCVNYPACRHTAPYAGKEIQETGN